MGFAANPVSYWLKDTKIPDTGIPAIAGPPLRPARAPEEQVI
jgi:hypothetical protein